MARLLAASLLILLTAIEAYAEDPYIITECWYPPLQDAITYKSYYVRHSPTSQSDPDTWPLKAGTTLLPYDTLIKVKELPTGPEEPNFTSEWAANVRHDWEYEWPQFNGHQVSGPDATHNCFSYVLGMPSIFINSLQAKLKIQAEYTLCDPSAGCDISDAKFVVHEDGGFFSNWKHASKLTDFFGHVLYLGKCRERGVYLGSAYDFWLVHGEQLKYYK